MLPHATPAIAALVARLEVLRPRLAEEDRVALLGGVLVEPEEGRVQVL